MGESKTMLALKALHHKFNVLTAQIYKKKNEGNKLF